jgi:hypothetical protein
MGLVAGVSKIGDIHPSQPGCLLGYGLRGLR